MRVQPSGRVSRAAPSIFTPRFGASALLLGLALLLAFVLGFLSHQQDWYDSVRAWGSALLRSPKVAFTAWRARQQLATLTVDLGFKDYQFLASVRGRALRQGVCIPSAEEIVTANVTLPGAGRSIPVDLRLSGGRDLGAAEGPWLLELRDGSLDIWQRLIPITNTLSAWQQWGYLETLRQNGFATAKVELLQLIVNGTSWGLYWLETPAVGELTLGFDPRPAWEALAQGQVLADGGFRYAVPAVSQAADPAARKAYTAFRAVFEGERALSAITDAEAWGRFLALTLLWTGAPAPDWSTLRWIYDPATGQLEVLGTVQPATISPLPASAFTDPVIQTAILRAVAECESRAYLDMLRLNMGSEFERLWYVLGGAYTGVTDPWNSLVLHQQAMRAYLTPKRPLLATLEASGDDFTLRLTNLQPFPLHVSGVDVGGVVQRKLEISWVNPEDRGALLENDVGAFVLGAADDNRLQPLEVQLPRELLSPGGELVLLCKAWNAPTQEVRVTVRETLPLLEVQP